MIWTILASLCSLAAPVPNVTVPLASAAGCTLPSETPHPAESPMGVEMKGELTSLVMEFSEDGLWELTTREGAVIGWGEYTYDEREGTIEYINYSGDGGGNQTGVYTWNEDTRQWDRTEASHPDAPEVSLIPNYY